MSLVEIRVHDLAVFADALAPLGPGFTALTGETGSGKSVCIGALRLALGERVDGDQVRAGSDAARVSAVFDDVPPAVRERLVAIGIPIDELTTLSRDISRAGRAPAASTARWCRRPCCARSARAWPRSPSREPAIASPAGPAARHPRHRGRQR